MISTLRSSTLVKTGKHVDSVYVQGYWAGPLVTDILHLHVGLNQDVRIQFTAITKQKKFFIKSTRFDGIFGLAYPGLARVRII